MKHAGDDTTDASLGLNGGCTHVVSSHEYLCPSLLCFSHLSTGFCLSGEPIPENHSCRVSDGRRCSHASEPRRSCAYIGD